MLREMLAVRGMRKRLRILPQDRSGATAIVFAVSGTVFIGMAGFGIETGTWYLEKRHGQNVADAAALGGVMALIQTPPGDPVAASTSISTANGYLTTEVNVTQGTYTGGAGCTATAPCNAVTARVTRVAQPLLTSLVFGNQFNIVETAKAAMATASSGCALSLTGGMTVHGNTTLSNCSLMSDANTTINGAAHSTTGGSIISAGTCTSNGGSNSCGPVDQPKVADPFASVQSAALPVASTTTCQSYASGAALVPFESAVGGGKIYCNGTFGTGASRQTYSNSFSLTAPMSIPPGTYVFYGGPNGSNATFSIGNGGNLTCPTCTIGGAGVTFIFTGDNSHNYATLSITGTVKLNAPATPTTCGLVAAPQCASTTTSFDSGAFKGILFYMDKNTPATNGNGNAPVVITANGTTTLTGGLYFPSVNVTYSGNAVATTNGCTEVVGKSLTFSGNTTLDVSHCSVSGTSVPFVQTAVLVQ
jgi:Flp pilus assembly protein TadG